MGTLEVITGARSTPVPGFSGKTYEDHVSHARMLKGNVERDMWALAAVCASLESKYGEQTIPGFAKDVGFSADYVRKMALTYRAWENNSRELDLSFTHYKIAAQSKNPQKAIEAAKTERMSKRQLEAYVRAEKKPDKQPQPLINYPAVMRRLTPEEAARNATERGTIEREEETVSQAIEWLEQYRRLLQEGADDA
jgi:hypothetical protein